MPTADASVSFAAMCGHVTRLGQLDISRNLLVTLLFLSLPTVRVIPGAATAMSEAEQVP